MKSMISINHTGDFSKTTQFLKKASSRDPVVARLRELGERGVQALASATPNSGDTARGWSYRVTYKAPNSVSIVWVNSVDAGTAPLAVLLQYGHGTRQGAYVQGRDYINPAMQPVFDEIANEVWNTITR